MRKRGKENEKGVGKMSAGSPSSTPISCPLFSAVGKEFSFPGWFETERWNEE